MLSKIGPFVLMTICAVCAYMFYGAWRAHKETQEAISAMVRFQNAIISIADKTYTKQVLS